MADREESILRRIEEAGHAAPRIRLRGLQDEPEAQAPHIARGSAGRYVPIGEIGRGATGIILQCRDFDIGRDVAMKVLRDEYQESPEWLSRFILEAQICGQLQHPGIVPVYELGIGANDAPYFTMKLVRGKTLSALLDEREDVREDRRRFLKIFEQICQTMAYAHSRGVIHSDLKPANVLVGNFGETQVADWGFAKVIEQGGVADEERAKKRSTDTTMVVTVRPERTGSGSDTGTLMATPAYMPPEQAMGQLSELDERSDVFCLGAILCEILTGLPPYTGDQGDLIEVAAQAKLEPAYERLDECGADPALIDLARRCLGPLRRHRPRDAGAVRKRLLQYVTAVEERAHNLQIETIEAEARAEKSRAEAAEQRRARRQAITLASLLIFAVVMTGLTYLWLSRTEEQRRVARSAAFQNYYATASLARREGRWEDARNAAKSAVQLASGALPAEQQWSETLLRKIEQESREAEADRTREEADRLFLAGLKEIRAGFSDEFDVERTDAAYAEAFGLQKIDVDRASVKDAAQAIRDRGEAAAVELAGVLDMWASVRWQIVRGPDGDQTAVDRWRKLVEIARSSDPDPARDRLRALWLESRRLDLEALREIAESMELEAQSVRTLDLLGIALLASDDRAGAVPLLKRIQRLHPDDAWTNWRLSRAISQIRFPRTADGLRYALAAVALRPQSSGLKTNLAWHFVDHGRAHLRGGRFGEARATLAAVNQLEAIPYDVQAAAERLERQCERLQLIEPHFDAIVAGTITPGSDREAQEFAALCSAKGHPFAAARLYHQALDGKSDWTVNVKQAAARAALLAGFGIGEDAKDLDVATRAKLRSDGLTWAEESIVGLDDRGALRRVARDWLSDPDLATAREVEGKAELSRKTRQRWRGLWRRLQSARRRSGG